LLLLSILNPFTFAQHQQNPDYDNDLILNEQDNCPFVANSGTAGELLEGQSGSFTVNGLSGLSYTVTLDFVAADEAKFTVNTEATPKLNVGEAYFLSDHSKIIIKEIFYQDYSNGIHGASFLIGAQKDSDKNGVGDACPHYGSEAERLEELQEQFNELEKEYYHLRYLETGEKDTGGKDVVKDTTKDTAKKLLVEQLVETVKEFKVNIQELQKDIEENDDLENRHELRDVLDELEEEGQRLQAKVADLLEKFSQQEQQYLPPLTYQPLSALELPALSVGEQGQPLPAPKVVVQKLNFPVSAALAGEELTNDQSAIFWLVVAIAVVLIMILFLLLAAVQFK
jgi:hypothetical protein